jgi:hypothetical protein
MTTLVQTESDASFHVREKLGSNQITLRSKILGNSIHFVYLLLHCCLGTGSYSKVLVGYSTKLHKTVAIKKIDKR